jgi:hypothetical protein
LFSTSPCDKADQAVQSISDKSQGCSGVTLPTLKGKTDCENAVANCNDAEKAIISEEMDCLIGNVGTCVAGQESNWLKSIATCIGATEGLSSSCKSGFGL